MNSRNREVLLIGCWAIFGLILSLIAKLVPGAALWRPFFVVFALFWLIYPGYLIRRIFKVGLGSRIGSFLLNFVFSLGLYLVVNLFGLFVHANINGLLTVYYVVVPLLLAGAVWQVLRQKEKMEPYNWKGLLCRENLIYALPLIFALAIFFVVSAKGADFNGDPYFHLSIARKAVEGQPLSIANLMYSKSADANPAYLLPGWQILTALFSRFTGADIFNTWSNLNLSLVAIALFGLFYFSKAIFKEKLLAVTAVLITYFFLSYAGPGYFFERLMVPDTLSQFILLPLAFTFSLKYIFEKRNQLLFPIGVLIFALLDVHAIHFLYYFFTMLVFAVVFAVVTLFKEKESLKKTGVLLLFSFFLTIIALVILEIKTHSASVALQSFVNSPVGEITYRSFKHFPISYKLAVLLSPLIIIFAKNRRILLIASSFLLVPLIYWTPLKNISIKLFSFIFTDRLLANAVWYYFIFAIAIGLIIVFLAHLASKTKKLLLSFSIAGILGLVAVIISEIYWNSISGFIYHLFFEKTNLDSKIGSFWLIFFLLALFSVAVVIYFKFSKKDLYYPETSNWFFGLILSAILSTALFSTSWPVFTKVWQKESAFWGKLDVKSKAYLSEQYGSDDKAIEFIRERITPKSTILADTTASRPLAMLTDNYMVYNQGSAWATKFKKVFNGEFKEDISTSLIKDKKYKIDYVYVSDTSSLGATYFERNPVTFTPVYNGTVKIYKVNK